MATRRTRSRYLEGDDLDKLLFDLDDKVRSIQRDVKPVVLQAAERAGMEMVVRIPTDTGRTAASVTWDEVAKVAGNDVSAEAGPEWYVARFIEYGTSKMPPRSFANAAATAAAVPFINDLADAGDLTQKRRTRK